jgi:crossover junction endodeoxyribonuclease RusA
MTDLAWLRFTVMGVPQPQGSSTAFIPKGWTRAIVTSANKKNKPWRRAVTDAATMAVRRCGWRYVETSAVSVYVVFHLPRPKVIKNKLVPHVKKPDVDKLARSILDGLTAVVFKDDSQVTHLTVVKEYAHPGTSPCAMISVDVVDPSTEDADKRVGSAFASAKATSPGRGGETGPFSKGAA